MNLRLRVVLTTLAAGVPALIALWGTGDSIRDARDEDLIRAMVLAHFSPAALDACEAAPLEAPIGIPLPAVKRGAFHAFGDADELVVWTYDRTGHSRQPEALKLPGEALDAVRQTSETFGSSLQLTIGGNPYLIVSLPRPDGPCALALTAGPRVRPPGPPPHELLFPLALALLAGLVAIWPVVRRIRRMTLAVRGWTEDAPRLLPPDANRDELSELSRALTDSAETVRRQHAALAAREKALLEFIENTTHDLATPLTVLQGNLAAIAKDQGGEAVTQGMKEAQYIGALLANLAVSAKFEAAAQVATSLDLRDVVSRVVDRHRAMAGWLGVAIERSLPEEPVLAVGDPTFTERALSNLVENALRHNRSGGHVAVVLEHEGGEFILRVLDDGPGLTREECDRALRSDEPGGTARSRARVGSGLGIGIVARVAELQKWRFALTPGESEGLVAELRGPAA
jgi:signal transduction histidine kinase